MSRGYILPISLGFADVVLITLILHTGSAIKLSAPHSIWKIIYYIYYIYNYIFNILLSLFTQLVYI